MLENRLVNLARHDIRVRAHIFSIPDAEDKLPSNKNHGLKPSDDLASIILRCYTCLSVAEELNRMLGVGVLEVYRI